MREETIKTGVTIKYTWNRDHRISCTEGSRINKDVKVTNKLPNGCHKGDDTDPRTSNTIGTRTSRAMEWHHLQDRSNDSTPTYRGKMMDTWDMTLR